MASSQAIGSKDPSLRRPSGRVIRSGECARSTYASPFTHGPSGVARFSGTPSIATMRSSSTVTRIEQVE